MATNGGARQAFNVMIVGQDGRLAFEAALCALSLRRSDPALAGRLFVAEPQPGPLWPDDPRIRDPELRALITDQGAEFLPFDSRHFGAAYPHGNKIEALFALPEGKPFLFLDTDTLVTGALSAVPFDFDRPCASLRREGTWPRIQPGGSDHAAIWGALYDRFGLDIGTSLDRSHPPDDWRRYLYFNAGWFFYCCPRVFGRRFLDYALSVKGDPPPELLGQKLTPWLDQIVLPLVIHALGGARRTLPKGLLDGGVTCHYRLLPLLYARECDRVVEVLEAVAAPPAVRRVLARHEPLRRMVYEREGHRVRALFDRADLPPQEQAIRRRIRQANLWMR